MLLADVVTTSAAVGATRARTAKRDAVADLLRSAAPDEVGPVTAWLSGAPRQGKLGAGWRTLSGVDAPPAAEPTLTVGAVEAALDELAAVTGAGSTARRAQLLGELFGAATAEEQSFLLRLLGGELRHGALEGVVLDAVAAAADAPAAVVRRAFFLSGELPAVAELALAGGVPALEAVRLQVGRPLRPMLASPADDLADALADGDVVVEQKMDGARIQVHKDGDDVRIWTRTLKEVTARVPELVDVVRGLPAQRLVLDGETLALTDDGRPRPFQETAARFGADTGELLLRPFFFDCLHVDGTDLVDEPLAVRRGALERVAGEHRMPGVQQPTPEQAAAFRDEALAAGHEGVVVKVLASPYAAGRRGSAWRKVKPVHTLDLVVIGAEWGYGRRTGSLSNIHLGARDPDGGEPVMVGKTFKGMTDELLAWQTRTFPDLVTATERGAVTMRPELVVEIELDGVQRSPRYPGGVALRFARVLRYRPDKGPAEADTVDAVRALLPGRGAAAGGLAHG
ncbi:ATP-dependent DNA ligase [Klenkia sp. PcliD-1-E]|uniref:ATP-dependent DNA ligase n=1 Tax=Klenkia sp. PcliD-1-E TaxID=2954492 RepID=UPI002097B39E|nr:ATP-dependent DNA ligase [Klenkia sp. PcliD-1-E]MCO7219079.1 ATP-dependent DNA ligase [Klenkia sp. PcliD-1-E]